MRATNATSEKKSTKKRQRQMAKKKRKKKFRQMVKKKVNGCGSLQDQKSHQVRKHEKTERQDLRKSQNVLKQGVNQNPGDTNQNLELGKKAQQA